MDQESGNGRRRSSRLAARGVVATPKPEVIKKTPKSMDKSKRQKRKQSEERQSPVAKKSKTEDEAVKENDSIKDNETPTKIVTESDQVDTVAVTTIPKKEEEIPIVSAATPELEKVSTDKPDADIVDSKEQEKMDVELPAENKNEIELSKPELTKEVESTHSQEVEKIEEEKAVKVSEKSVENGLPEKEINDVHSENNEKESNGVANTSNGTTDEECKKTNGEESITKPDVGDTVKVVCEGKNHVSESETNYCNTILNTSNNDIKEQENTESNKAIEKSVGNTTSSEGIATNVDKPSTVVS